MRNTKRELEVALEGMNDQLWLKTHQLVVAHQERQALEAKLRERVDQSMIESRIKLANALGQMIEAVTRAVVVVVAKETM